ncbi:SCP2 sterol-binding domain-containing protein [Pseudemcibacter aquimaris]|uniref:SCP2 sterol-binding domain-containing protein n=1 Tax=Pseudemcibacter aquimaris TaxID=2857064 RepID=UPI0020112582|nr:SCP2 sterol-binding domain-containing protein [Pseudemcibacter aquimaris]MCC3859856.1 SCP2 sterol-binding domain-containing protein [Pseudemcibacter aquimaris]WDU57188.1 SCP2 sterol-binding domain-containing protein [Pseudemcibacter aquimaris]
MNIAESSLKAEKSYTPYRSGHGTFTPLYLAGITTKRFPSPPIDLASQKINENLGALDEQAKEKFEKLAGKRILMMPDDVSKSFVITFTKDGSTTEYVSEEDVFADLTLSGPLFALINLLNDNNDMDALLFFRQVNTCGDKGLLSALNQALAA